MGTPRPQTLNSMRCFNKFVIFVVAALTACGAQMLRSQEATLSPQDMSAAEAAYRSLDSLNSPDLHSLSKDRDGVRGYDVGEACQCVLIPLGPFPSEAEAEFHDRLCRTTSVVVARDIGAQSFLSDDKRIIFTLTEFQVVNVFKSSPDAQVGARIGVMRFGGEVTDDGERLRVEYSGQIPYREGQEYLLLLGRNAGATTTYFFGPNDETVVVQDGRIYPTVQETDPPTPPKWGPFVPGERLEKVREEIDDISALAPCK
jgi:hypothetical protein